MFLHLASTTIFQKRNIDKYGLQVDDFIYSYIKHIDFKSVTMFL